MRPPVVLSCLVGALLCAAPVRSQVDCLGVLGGFALPGTACNDNDAFTGTDTWDANCVCVGLPFDCSGTPGGPLYPGMACDDGSPITVNDVVDVDCVCRGISVLDCNFVEFGTAWPGTPCDDGDPLTTTEVWSPNCICTVPAIACDGVPFGYQDTGFPCDDGDPWTVGEVWSTTCACDTGGFDPVSGFVFLDVDLNGSYGPGDHPILNRTVRAVPGSSMTTTGPDSSFWLPLSAGTYELIVSPGAADVQSGTPYMVTVTNGVASPGHQLAMTATAPLHDLAGWGTMAPAPRPGFTTTISVFVSNTGNVRTDGTVDLVFDPLQQFVSSNPAAILNGNTLSWDLDTLELGEVVMLQATVLTPSIVPLGTQLVLTAQLTAPDDDPTNDAWTITPLVVGAYDPNDKQVTPGTLTPQEVTDGTPVTYTIRFQNTGTFLAEHVRLVDTLPAELDPTTLTFIGSTHPCEVHQMNDVLDLRFDHIMLPDSGTDQALSQGSATFRFTPDNNLPLGTVVANRADIHFDFNAPIRTNDAVLVVDQTSGAAAVGSRAADLRVQPNPATHELRVLLPDGMGERVQVRVIDQAGRAVEQVDRTTTTAVQLDVSHLCSGLYTVQVTGAGRTAHARFVKRP